MLVDKGALAMEDEPGICGPGELVPSATGVSEPNSRELCGDANEVLVKEDPVALDDEPEFCEVEELMLVLAENADVVEIGSESVGEVVGRDDERADFMELVKVDPRRTRISESVFCHATGIPSFHTVRSGLGLTVTKL